MDKNEIILQLKSELFELEQKIECMENLENSNINLKNENLELLQEKNKYEYDITKLNDYYTKIVNDLKNEVETYKENLEKKKETNKQLFDENEQLKKDNNKITQEYEQLKNDFELLIQKQNQYEQTIHNMSQIQIDIKRENDILVKDNKNLVKVCKDLSRKKVDSYIPKENKDINYSYGNRTPMYQSGNELEFEKLQKIKNCLIDENGKLKHHILVLTDQNQNVCKYYSIYVF